VIVVFALHRELRLNQRLGETQAVPRWARLPYP
jgi:hypothetical protein